MANMSHCRFQNTLQDLRDCRENMYESTAGKHGDEIRARQALFDLVIDMADEIENMSVEERENGIPEPDED